MAAIGRVSRRGFRRLQGKACEGSQRDPRGSLLDLALEAGSDRAVLRQEDSPTLLTQLGSSAEAARLKDQGIRAPEKRCWKSDADAMHMHIHKLHSHSRIADTCACTCAPLQERQKTNKSDQQKLSNGATPTQRDGILNSTKLHKDPAGPSSLCKHDNRA